ncbi:MAG: Mut7-C RNAse domain-containing protein [Elusimicrobiota bacterium]
MSGAPGRPKFLADCMLAKVARWLAFLGYDSAFATKSDHDDIGLLERAQREGRVFLTRDTKIPDVSGLRKIVIREQRFEDQLKRVIDDLGLAPDPALFFTRCTLCNRPLAAVRREEVLDKIPPKVRGLKTSFYRCPSCRRLYWSGTHVARAAQKLRAAGILPASDPG